jgi:hypothetical protein
MDRGEAIPILKLLAQQAVVHSLPDPK